MKRFAPLLLVSLSAFFASQSIAQEEAGDSKQSPTSQSEPEKKDSGKEPEKKDSDKKEESKAGTENQASEKTDSKKTETPANNPNTDSQSKKDEPGNKPTAKEGAKEKSNDKSDKSDAEKPVKEEPKKPTKKVLPKYGSTNNQMIPGQPWKIHDINRPRPKAVSPGESNDAPPADAIVLFDGTTLSDWCHHGPEEEYYEPMWKIEDGYFEIVPNTGSLYTIDSFASCQLHLEWQIPEGVQGTSQNRGNSGVKLMERYELQILDSFKSRTYADGQAGAIYGQYPPSVNATRPQGKWQTYDAFFEAPVYEGDKLVKQPVITLLHNGIFVQHHRELSGPTGAQPDRRAIVPPASPIMLQDHGSPIRFKNIWIRPL